MNTNNNKNQINNTVVTFEDRPFIHIQPNNAILLKKAWFLAMYRLNFILGSYVIEILDKTGWVYL